MNTKDCVERKKTFTCLIYGEPGTGKSTFASSASNALLLDCENGAYRMASKDLMSISVSSISSMPEFLNISLNDLTSFDTIIIDTIGALTQLAIRNINSSGRLSVQQWGTVLNQMNIAMQKFIGQKNLIITAHVERKNVGSLANPRMRLLPQSQGSYIDQLISLCDVIGYMYRDDNHNRVITFEGDDLITAKNTYNLPQQIFIPDNQKLSNNAFASAIEKHITKYYEQEEALLQANEKKKQQYDELWELFSYKIEQARTPEQFTLIRNEWLNEENIWGIHDRLRTLLANKNKLPQFQFAFDKEQQCFLAKNKMKEEKNDSAI